MPKPDAGDVRRSFLPNAAKGDPQQAVVAGLLDRKDFALREEEIRRECRILNLIEGETLSVDRNALLTEFHRTDQSIRFYRDYDSLVDATTAKAAAPGPPPNLRHIEKAYAKASIQGTGPVRVETGPEQWSFAAFLPIDFSTVPEGKAWVSVRAEVAEGTVGFGVYDRDGNSYLSRKYIGADDVPLGDVLLPVEEHGVADGLMIENGAPGGSPSAVTIEEVRILVPARSRIAGAAAPLEAEPDGADKRVHAPTAPF